MSLRRSAAALTPLQKPATLALLAALEKNVTPLTELFRTWYHARPACFLPTTEHSAAKKDTLRAT
eukprot:1988663-Prymnesium_polylepis.1